MNKSKSFLILCSTAIFLVGSGCATTRIKGFHGSVFARNSGLVGSAPSYGVTDKNKEDLFRKSFSSSEHDRDQVVFDQLCAGRKQSAKIAKRFVAFLPANPSSAMVDKAADVSAEYLAKVRRLVENFFVLGSLRPQDDWSVIKEKRNVKEKNLKIDPLASFDDFKEAITFHKPHCVEEGTFRLDGICKNYGFHGIEGESPIEAARTQAISISWTSLPILLSREGDPIIYIVPSEVDSFTLTEMISPVFPRPPNKLAFGIHSLSNPPGWFYKLGGPVQIPAARNGQWDTSWRPESVRSFTVTPLMRTYLDDIAYFRWSFILAPEEDIRSRTSISELFFNGQAAWNEYLRKNTTVMEAPGNEGEIKFEVSLDLNSACQMARPVSSFTTTGTRPIFSREEIRDLEMKLQRERDEQLLREVQERFSKEAR